MASERGRPRSFDLDHALDQAMAVFWRHGYQAASLSELTDAMGLTRPSLYAAFGDKQGLYLQALERYGHTRLQTAVDRLDAQQDARQALADYLYAMAQVFAQGGGCFVVNGLADGGGPAVPDEVQAALQAAFAASESRLVARLKRAQKEGQLPRGRTPQEWAAHLTLFIAGLAVRAKSGLPQPPLRPAIELALAAWPDAPAPSARR